MDQIPGRSDYSTSITVSGNGTISGGTFNSGFHNNRINIPRDNPTSEKITKKSVEEEGSRYSVIVGIDNYGEGISSLKGCSNDAGKIKDILEKFTNKFKSSESKAFSNCSRNTVLIGLNKMIKKCNSKDTLIFYFAGHSTLIKDKLVLLCNDSSKDLIDIDNEGEESSGIYYYKLLERIERCVAKKKIIILDSCYSGKGRDYKDEKTNNYDEVIERSGNIDQNICCISACSENEKAFENIGGGAFTSYLIKGINEIISQKNDVEMKTLWDYIRKNLPRQTSYTNIKSSIPLEDYFIAYT